jgi:hypothetical protein
MRTMATRHPFSTSLYTAAYGVARSDAYRSNSVLTVEAMQ